MISAAEALRNSRNNRLRRWNKSADSATRSTDPNDASNRIFDQFADIQPTYTGPKFDLNTPVFAMGSCFAREIEWALQKRGASVISIDETIERPEFEDAGGKISRGFFHRYTPNSMAQEFQWPFGLDGWNNDSLIFETSKGVFDLNYGPTCSDRSIEAVRVRREIAGELVRKMIKARIIIVTLGLAEGWFHLPTGLAINAVDGQLLHTRGEEFGFRRLSHADTVKSLREILTVIRREHIDGDFQMFVTVSPVPFASTFSADDVVVANATSKATLRAAAAEFVESEPQVHYFPSFEIVSYSPAGLAWRPDRIHVEPTMVKHITDRFVNAVYDLKTA